MISRNTFIQWAAAAFASLAMLTSASAQKPLEIETAETDPLIQRFQEDLNLIQQMRDIYQSQGDKEAVASLTREIQKIKTKFYRMSELSKIEVDPSTDTSIHTLSTNTARLSGKYRPTFSFVGEAIDGAQFTRVPWKSQPTFNITAVTSGYIYMIGVTENDFDKTDSHVIEAPETLEGKYVGKCYRAYLRKGQTYEVSGYETCLISRSITIEEK